MLEFTIRLIGAGLIFLLSAWFGIPSAGVGWEISIAIAIYAGIGYWLETRGRKNSGICGILAVCDSGAIVFSGASIHAIDPCALLSLLPVLYAFKKHRANLWATVPCVAGLLFSSAVLFLGPDVSANVYVEALAALLLPLILRLPPADAPQPPRPQMLPRISEIDSEAFLMLRENFRKVKDRCKELEEGGKREHILAQLHSTRLASNHEFHGKLSDTIRKLCGAQSAAVYTLSQFGNTMVVRGTSGPVQSAVETASYTVNLGQATRQIIDQVELTTRAMLVDEERAKVATVLLTHESRMVGMVNLFHNDWDELYEAKRMVEDCAQTIAWIIVETQRKADHDKRLKELELLYETAVVSTGAGDRQELVARVSHRLAGIVKAEFIGAYLVEDDEPVLVGNHGHEMDFLDCMSFSAGNGFEGWLAAGAPELAVFQSQDDQRCHVDMLLRKRIGSFILVPLQFEESPFGFLVAVSKVSNGLDSSDLAALRAVSAECAQAVCRLEQPSANGGLVTPSSFQRTVANAKSGCLVHLELLKRQQLIENCDSRAIEEGLRQFSYRLRGKLTAGGAACQRGLGGFVIYLPNSATSFVSNWANEVAATASMIGVPTSGKKTTIPLAFRARVANLVPQSDEDLARVSA
jgi:hypothetical protein